MTTNKKIMIAAIIVAAIILIYVGYTFAKNKSVKVPGNGSDIPENWDALPVAIQIRETMEGIGTDEDRFFSIMSVLTTGQRAVLYNVYNAQYGSIIEDIKSDFSGDSLTRALELFKGIEGIALRMPMNQYIIIRPT